MGGVLPRGGPEPRGDTLAGDLTLHAHGLKSFIHRLH